MLKIDKINTIISGLVLIVVAATGERDYLFRFALLTVFVLWYYKAIRFKHLLVIMPLMFIVVVLSLNVKYAFLTGVISTNNRSLLENFLRADFNSNGENLNRIIRYNFGSIFSIKNIFIDIIDANVIGNWYASQIGINGAGFSLVGFGYIIAGLPGVCLIFTIVGIFIHKIYVLHTKQIRFVLYYFVMIITIIYSFRSSFHTVAINAISYFVLILIMDIFFINDLGCSECKAIKPKKHYVRWSVIW
ncbi:hypothetical protein FACS1894184_16190 [Clostridia bacterium]|nr:hypothetical protein FACS1894184_16190 [Clostridia bacterium]